MISVKLSLFFCLLIFFKRAVCDEVCNEEAKGSLPVLLCDEASRCSDETAEELLDNFRECLSNCSDMTHQLIESSNKLQPDECVKEISGGTCEILKDIKEHPFAYAGCLPMLKNAESLLTSCIQTAGNQPDSLEKLAKIVCSDPTKLKCKTNEAMEVFNLMKSCMNENVHGIKQVKNSGDLNKCKVEAKKILVEMKQEITSIAILKCMESKKDFIDFNDPTEKCTGF